MKLSKLSNQTNSQDPQAVNSRIFVGNLNTFQCSKTDVERMFQIYGRLAGISMHKGYAFVQFTNPFDARNACHGEDGRNVLSQTLDVNMVAEPKAHQIGRKRQNITKTGNDWDYFYDSYCSSTLFRASGIRPKKRKRLMSTTHARMLADAVNSSNLNSVVAVAQQQQQQQHQHQQLQQQQHYQQQQQHHHHHQQQQPQQQQQHHHPHHQQQQHQVTAVAMAAMANLLPQQQLLLHQQNLLTNGAANSNSNPTSPHHSLSAFLQQQQQQQQQSAMIAAVNHNSLAANGDHLSIVNNTAQLMQQHGSPQLLQQQQAPLLPMPPQQIQQQQPQQHSEQLTSNQHWGPYKVYSNPDTLICGNCRECFTELAELLDHKRSYCKLRFTCKCQDVALAAKTQPTSARLLCAVCKDAFANPWDLMVHAQTAHMVNIYELGNEANSNNNNNSKSSTNNNANCGDIVVANAAAAVTVGRNVATAAKDIEVTEILNNEQRQQQQQKQHNNITTSNNNNKAQQLSPTSVTGLATTTVMVEKPLTNGNAAHIVDEHVSDLEQHSMDIKFGLCSSPHGSLPKEDAHPDDVSLDGRMSNSSHTHHSDDLKMQNGSMSSRGSSPAMDGVDEQQPRACIVRTLSIEATASPPSNAAALGMLAGGLTLSLTNGAATLLPQ